MVYGILCSLCGRAVIGIECETDAMLLCELVESKGERGRGGCECSKWLVCALLFCVLIGLV
jgi:hypothetical protein